MGEPEIIYCFIHAQSCNMQFDVVVWATCFMPVSWIRYLAIHWHLFSASSATLVGLHLLSPYGFGLSSVVLGCLLVTGRWACLTASPACVSVAIFWLDSLPLHALAVCHWSTYLPRVSYPVRYRTAGYVPRSHISFHTVYAQYCFILYVSGL